LIVSRRTADIAITRSQVRLFPDPARRIVRPYRPPDDSPSQSGPNRVERILERVLDLTPEEVSEALADVYDRFADRYADFDQVLLDGFSTVERLTIPQLSDDQRRVISAYFLHEYSVEAAALTNPSIVAHPDQGGLAEGVLRVVISLRAVGEGHISSIEFRTGEVDAQGAIEVIEPSPLVRGTRETPLFDKVVFAKKLEELGTEPALVEDALGALEDHFTMTDLEATLSTLAARVATPLTQKIVHTIHWLASSNYRVTFAADSDLSQRILVPGGPAESRGMEDARFVRFVDNDDTVRYYGTYTAFDGFDILPQLIETTDFETFRVATLNGSAAVNKGLAVFPRRIAGRFAALGRSDGESNYLMMTDNVRFWDDAVRIQVPARSWELIQIGNAGAPIETEAGWLVITHGVGPMRQYALGAILLDLDEPSHVIGHLPEPLLEADEGERDGYVPNVVYSCGAVLQDGNLIVAYGASDTSARFATLSVDSVLSALTPE
jgi:predicted GH43/DUF377 family glycosyl hydrolase